MNCRALGLAVGLLLVLLTARSAPAQHVYSPADSLSDTNITVHVNGPDNKPLKQQSFVTLYQRSSNMPLGTVMTTVSSEAVLAGMPGYGPYTVTVTSAGYETASRDFEYNASSGRVHIDVTLALVSGKDATPPASGALPPKAEEQKEKGLAAMQAGKFPEAIANLLAAHDAAPKDSEICYLLGAAYQKNKDVEKAGKYLEMAAAIDPGNVQALVALGQLRDQEKNYEAAKAPLEKAAALDGSEWLARWVLADACFRTGEYEKARKNAEEAVEIGKGEANKAELIEGQALAQLGRREDAIKVLQSFLRDLPGDPAVPAVKALVEKLESGAGGAAAKPGAPE